MLRTVVLKRGNIGYGFSINSKAPAVIEAIVKDSAADYAALQVGDIMYEINDVEVDKLHYDSIIRLITNPNDSLKLLVECKKKNPHLLPSGTFWSPRRVSIVHDVKKNKRFLAAKKNLSDSKSKSDSNIKNGTNPLLAELQKDSLFAKMRARINSQESDNEYSDSDTDSSLPPPMKALTVNKKKNADQDRGTNRFSITYSASKIHSSLSGHLENTSTGDMLDAVIVKFVGSRAFTHDENFYSKSLSEIRDCMQELKQDQENRLLLTLFQFRNSSICIKSSSGEINQCYNIDQLAVTGTCLDDKHFFGLVFCDKKDGAKSIFSLHLYKCLSVKCNYDQAAQQFHIHRSKVEIPSLPQSLLRKLSNLHMQYADNKLSDCKTPIMIDNNDLPEMKNKYIKIRTVRSDTAIDDIPQQLNSNDKVTGGKRSSSHVVTYTDSENNHQNKRLKTRQKSEIMHNSDQSEQVSNPMSDEKINQQPDVTPSKDRVATWKTKIELLLVDPAGIRIFYEYLMKEHSEENILFLHACQKFKKLPTTEIAEIKKFSSAIYRTYLADDAAMPINVDYIVLKTIRKYLKSPNVTMFDMAQRQIINLLKFDSYQRFLNSELYKTLLSKEAEKKLVLNNEIDVLIDHVFVTTSENLNADKKTNENKNLKGIFGRKGAQADNKENVC
ncbi:uncharacterized protein TRIADDRAFT_58629 [Trichoplax adhaerens]|uniref:RGS domain-containing protein n=1 Tax=Trichoplax adhaerens TaxID=10228 RepID=B3S382_TRIAD|nr:hypothetical protein TRIADDRAFT_58629 [Trichoplax adhaerens]EDV22744.1 hypothetical protein TRIADDRAFT_58629 [Trichoplax adhaerens]|eukprot:XP_002114610.1 hypothetical protein TRIADDRAFT_58629 [Trichoplax adhaerens]